MWETTVKTVILCEKQNIAMRRHRRDATCLDTDDNLSDVVQERTRRHTILITPCNVSKIMKNDTLIVIIEEYTQQKIMKNDTLIVIIEEYTQQKIMKNDTLIVIIEEYTQQKIMKNDTLIVIIEENTQQKIMKNDTLSSSRSTLSRR